MDWEEEAGSSANFINTGKPSSILRLLRNREIGRRKSAVIPILVRINFDEVSLTVISKQQETCLDKRMFYGRGSGFLGITHNSHYLVAIHSKPQKTRLFFFAFTMEAAMLDRIMSIDTPNGIFYNIKVFVPPVGSKFIAAFVYDEAEYKRLTAKENNLSIHLYMSPRDQNFQVNISNLIVVVARFLHGSVPPRRSLKNYIVAHENGIILNTGITMINFMFLNIDSAEQCDKYKNHVRKIWTISRQKCYSWNAAEVPSKVTVDLGEEIEICGTADFLKENSPYEYKLHQLEKPIPSERETVPMVFIRDYFGVESWLCKRISKHLRMVAKFQGCAFRSLHDYEVDVKEVTGFRANVQAFALCELEVYQKSSESCHEFHLFNLNFIWDLLNCTLYSPTEPQHYGQIEMKLAFGNRWWPVKTITAVPTTNNHTNLNNAHILTGERIGGPMSTCDDRLELRFDREDVNSVRPVRYVDEF